MEMMMKQKVLAVAGVLALFLFTLSACAGVQRYETGLHASNADKFFFHMDQEARSRGYQTSRSNDSQTGWPDTLNINVPTGTITYDVNNATSGIDVVFSLARTNGVSQQVMDKELADMRRLHDEMMAGARARAEDANVFD